MTIKEASPDETPSNSSSAVGKTTYGRNGVPITIHKKNGHATAYRTYEVFQRRRVDECRVTIKPTQLVSPEFIRNPYPTLDILRENYPLYRDWIGNSFWATRYDDVTSIFVDDANFETRSKRSVYEIYDYGRDLRNELPVIAAYAKGVDTHAKTLAIQIISEFSSRGDADLATEVAARYPLELLLKVLGLPREDFEKFSALYWRMQRGIQSNPKAEYVGLTAIQELTDYFRPLLASCRAVPQDNLLSAIAHLDLMDGAATAEDVVITLLESDHETLHGALANMWFLLLTHPEQLAQVTAERRLVKFAYLETLRHSAPVVAAKRFARHEVERLGHLIPEGALVMCSAAAANRDPRNILATLTNLSCPEKTYASGNPAANTVLTAWPQASHLDWVNHLNTPPCLKIVPVLSTR